MAPLDSAAYWWRPPVGLPVNTGKSINCNGTKNMLRTQAAGAATDNNKCSISFWLKQTRKAGDAYAIYISADGTQIDILSSHSTGTGGSEYYGRAGNIVKRWNRKNCFDPTEWVHFLYTLDLTRVTADRLQCYMNNELLTDFTTAQTIGTGVQPWTEAGSKIGIACYSYSPTVYRWQGYIHYPVLVDGQILDPTDFGYYSDNGKWMPKQYIGSVGNKGFILDFNDPTNLGKDITGHGDFTTTYTTDDIYADSPATVYPYLINDDDSLAAAPTYDEDRLSCTGSASDMPCVFSHVLTSGKWYWEITPAVTQTTGLSTLGLCELTVDRVKQVGLRPTGVYLDETGATSSYGAAWLAGETIGVEVDLSISPGTIRFYVGGTWGPLKNLDTTVPVWQIMTRYNGNASQKFVTNFGQKPFAHAAPSGCINVNSQNIVPPIDPSLYFGVLEWTGNGGALGIGGLNFTPDMVWIKHRAAAEGTLVFNSSRGTGKYVLTSSTAGEVTDANTLTSFSSGGIGLGSSVLVNKTGDAYIGYCWKKSPTAGFDIVTYTGDGTAARDIAHSLGKVPMIVIIKRLDATAARWAIWDKTLATNGVYLGFDAAGFYTDTTVFPVSPVGNSSTFRVGNNVIVNASGVPYIAFVFAQIPGLSHSDAYTKASGATPGCNFGFRPGLVIGPKSVNTVSWWMYDNVREAPEGQYYTQFSTAAAESVSSPATSYASGTHLFNSGNAGKCFFWAWGVKSHKHTRMPIPGNP